MAKSIAVGVVSAMALVIPGAARADGPAWQKFEGIYRPIIADGVHWSCEADDLGQEGGSLGVVDGSLFGLENTCDLTNPRLQLDGSVTFAAICEAEGERIKEEIALAMTSDGISVSRSGRTVAWQSCDQPNEQVEEIDAPDHDGSFGAWTSYSGMGWIEAGTTDNRGGSLTFSCGEDRTQHYAGGVDVVLSGNSPAAGPIRFEVDGQSYSLTQLANGGVDLDCQGCEQTFRGLWVAVSMGRSLIVTDQAGATATFSLVGSGAALGYDVCNIGEPID